MKQGIKETKEALVAIKDVIIPVKKSFADHKIDGKDIPNLMELIGNHEEILAGIEGSGAIIDEAKDYDMIELAEIGKEAIEIIKAIKEA